MENKHLHVAVASDSNYARMVSVLLTSLFDNNPEFDDIKGSHHTLLLFATNVLCCIEIERSY